MAYTGEVGNVKDESDLDPAVVGGVKLYSYKKEPPSPFLVDKVNYVGTIGASTLNYDGHPGYDYPVPIGREVHAAAYGKVVCVNSTDVNYASGLYIQVQHDSAGYLTQYLHLSKVDPSVVTNALVTRGQVIGLSGDTGTSTGPHLHFEVKKNYFGPLCPYQGISVDPYGWTGSGMTGSGGSGPDPYASMWQAK